MKRLDTSLRGVFLIEPTVFSDERGFFYESYHKAKFAEIGIRGEFVQDNHSKSAKGTLRGLHYQLGHPQAKLCRVVYGDVLDAVVDIRRGSPTFGRSLSTVLSADNKRLIYIPAGFAHGFLVLSETAEFLYKCDDFYYPAEERGIAWSDPDLGIEWGIDDPIISGKDKLHPRLSAVPSEHLPVYRPG
jgi:dTDP-4-dehydrorhamnose 3,5-epimerase